MAKLGYTWYPKDWGNSENVFELNLSERGLYRELIDLAMLNDNKTEIKLDVWCRKFAIDIDGLKSILGKLIILNLIIVDGEKLFIPSCESRLQLVRGGKKGGENKPTTKPTTKPDIKPDIKPDHKQIETKIETKIENETKLNLIETYFNDLPNSSQIEAISINLKKTKEYLIKIIPEFKKVSSLEYKSFNDFCDHFKRWVNKQSTNVEPVKKRHQPIG
jgi:hypothetical protein